MAEEGVAQQEVPAQAAVEPAASAGRRRAEPSWMTPVLLIGIAVILYLVRRILPPFIIAAVLAYIFGPIVTWIEKRARIPRAVAVLLFFILALGPLLGLMWALEPTLVRETKDLVTNTPAILRNLLVQLFGDERIDLLGVTVDADSAADYLLGAIHEMLGTPAGAIHIATIAVEVVLQVFISLVLLFYFLLDPNRFSRAASRLIPAEHRAQWQKVGGDIHAVLGRYVRGLAFLVGLMSAVTWIGLSLIFQLPYALPIAIATGFLEIIPFLGPVVAGIVAATVGLFHGGPEEAIWIAAFYLAARQLEDHLVMPVVLGRAVELYPAVAIFAVLAGGALGGVLGALLGIPVAAAIKIALDRWRPA